MKVTYFNSYSKKKKLYQIRDIDKIQDLKVIT